MSVFWNRLVEFSKDKQTALFLAFYLPLFIYASLGKGGQGFSSISAYGIAVIFGLLCWSIKCIGAGYSKLNWLVFLIAVAIQVCVSRYNGERRLFMATLAIFAIINVDIYKVARILFWLRLCIVIPVMGLAATGIITDYTREARKVWIDGDKRITIRGYGYEHPNYTAFLLISLVVLFYVGYYSKIKKTARYISYLSLVVLMVLFYSILQSKTALLMAAVLILMLLVFELSLKNKILGRIYRILISITPLFSCTACVVILFLYEKGTKVGSWINNILNNRFLLYSLNHRGTLSQSILWGAPNKYSEEVSYLILLHNYGWLITLALLLLYFVKMIQDKGWQENNIVDVLFAVMAVYGIMECYVLNASLNFIIVRLGSCIFGIELNNKGACK